MSKVALITGINGMDGSHLADLLLGKGYEVYGVERRSSTKNRTNTSHLEGQDKMHFITADLTDQNSLYRALKETNPDEVYNLAAQSFVASTSEMFGKNGGGFANEETPFYPRSPYGVAKLFGYWMVKNYRESYDMFACSGILFNHESERRGIEFVTRKISDGVARISLGLADSISLGNVEAKRDWGYAPDYVEGMWLMLQQDTPQDYVLATGESHSIKDFLEAAFAAVGITDWEPYITIDPKFFRPAEVDVLKGAATKAQEELGWEPKTSFKELVEQMVRNDLELLSKNH